MTAAGKFTKLSFFGDRNNALSSVSNNNLSPRDESRNAPE
jgi:hypothetical protein